jgi:hypothetical protein
MKLALVEVPLVILVLFYSDEHILDFWGILDHFERLQARRSGIAAPDEPVFRQNPSCHTVWGGEQTFAPDFCTVSG